MGFTTFILSSIRKTLEWLGDVYKRQDLNNHFMGECTEVGMYLAMSRQADREGYPEVEIGRAHV